MFFDLIKGLVCTMHQFNTFYDVVTEIEGVVTEQV